jgi:hypothetical protein
VVAEAARTLCAKNESFRAFSMWLGSSSPAAQNISLGEYPKSVVLMFPFRSSEGRIAIVTNAERDCGGRGVLCAVLCADEQRLSRDGEVMWSWRSDAGAK